MKKLIPFLLFIIFLVAGCSNMLLDLQDLELESGENIRLSGTDGADVTGIAIDINDDGRPDGIDINGDGNIDFTFVIADSTPSLGVYASDTNGDGIADIYIRVSSSGTSTMNTSTDGSGPVVSIAVNSEGEASFSGAEIPVTGADPSIPTVAATTDINGDGTVDSADTALLAKLTFTVTGDTVTITGADSSISGVLNIPETYDGKPVTLIGSEAFKDCSSLAAVTIPTSVTDIGAGAFSGCTGLTSMTMLPTIAPTAGADILAGTSTAVSLTYPDGATGYDEAGTVWVDTSVLLKDGDGDGDGVVDADDTALLAKLTFTITGDEATLTGVTDTTISGALNIPAVYGGKPVTVIDNVAFTNCTLLTAVTMPASITIFGDEVFKGCTNLSALTMLSKTAPSTGDNVFQGITDAINLSFPSGATGYDGSPWDSIHAGDLNGDGSVDADDTAMLAKLTFTVSGDSVTITAASSDISGVLNIPATYDGKPVTSIGNLAFQNCSSLTSVTIPANVITIDSSAFSGCTGLTSLIMLPTTAPTAAADILTGISTPVSLTYPEGETSYDEAGTVWVDTSVLLKDGDVDGDGVVDGNDETVLDSISFSAGEITDVPTTLSGTLIIPSTIDGVAVTSIGFGAFLECTSLTTITLPSSIVSIGTHGFTSCSELETLTLLTTTAPTTGTTVFDSILDAINIRFPSQATGFDESPWKEAMVGDVNFDYSVDSDDVTQFENLTFTETSTEAILTGCSTSTSDRLQIPEWINGKTVTEISSNAFKDCTSLNYIEIPDNVTVIGSNAFDNCTNLKAFSMLSSAAPSVGTDAFSDITDAYLSTQADATGYDESPWDDTSVFYKEGDYNGDGSIDTDDDDILALLTFVTINTYYTKLSAVDVTISGKLVIPRIYGGREVSQIWSTAAYQCTNLTSVVIPNTVTYAGSSPFYQCTSLTAVAFSSELSELPQGMFGDCTALTTIDIPGTVETISDYTFSGCTGLTSINIESGLTTIGKQVFDECSALTSITLPDTVISIAQEAFRNCISLESVTLSSELITIESSTFAGCIALTAINIPSSVTLIDDYAFNNCTSLESVTLPSELLSINKQTFFGCTALTAISIPNSITSIGEYAFGDCTALNSLTIAAETAPTTGAGAFNNISDDSTLNYPTDADGYNVSPWTTGDGYFSTVTTF